VTASAPGYSAVTQNNVVVITGQTTTLNFVLPVSQVAVDDGFETYANFSIAFDPWTLVDVDMSTTYGMTGITWENGYDPQAFIVFNPSAASPAITDMPAHGGDKFAACFASTTPPNNDWMITPTVAGGGIVRFYAKSYTDDYGLERFKVGVSNGSTNPNEFTIISGANFIEAPLDWTMYEYPLTAYAGQNIRVGIQCLSNDAFIFMVDDFYLEGGSDTNDPSVPAIVTSLNGNYPNPFNPETTINYSLATDGPVTINIYNARGQLVKTLVNDQKAAGIHSIVWNGTDNNGSGVSSGVYFYKMYAGKYSSTRKMILMK
ncbi:MAG: choice-of-anchor J domain-containing protein, partial [Candidatus Cloacimonadota bacterium]